MKRLPDVVIIGVKKSGTMTLGRTEDIYHYLLLSAVFQTHSSSITPTLWCRGKTGSSVLTMSTGRESLTSYLPCLGQGLGQKKLLRSTLNMSREDQLILIKTAGVWSGNDSQIILPRKDSLPS